MAVKKYKKGAKTKLSKNFNQSEFDCHCSCNSVTLIDTELVSWLQKIRDKAGKPVTITSAYRCKVNNARAGGVSNSKHMLGMAADIQIAGLKPNDIAKIAEQVGCRGILRYTGPKNFVHIDTRPSKYWGYTTNGGSTFTAVTTFGTDCPYAIPKETVRRGSNGNAVKWVQWMLNRKGYPCKIDGDFGTATYTQLVKYQSKNGLKVDGVAGTNTIAKLK